MVRQIVLDFDGTITENDTIGNIANAALVWRKSTEGGGIDLTGDWRRILQAYTRDLAAYDQTQPSEQQRTTWIQERDYLHGRRVVEEASLARVRDSGIFTGFAANHRLFKAGRRDVQTGRTRLRDGFTEYVNKAKAFNDDIHVVSVNWSASYIKGVLEPWGITSVIANEIQLDGSIAIPLASVPKNWGHQGHPMTLTTSADKLEITQHLLSHLKDQCVTYLGDSTTDLECLGKYGGHVVTSDGGGNLLGTLRRLGCDVPDVSDSLDADPHISWMRDFTKIAA